jgi:3-deoxy-7-phosphoheptulonate synthase
MVIVLHRRIKEHEKRRLEQFLTEKGFRIREIVGEEETILGAVGLVPIDLREVELLPGVERVIPISKPYKLASRELKKEDSVIQIGDVKIGGNRIVAIAGPCAVESAEQIDETARIVRESGGVMLRGGAYKPRSSPYSFQGLGEEGLKYLKDAGERYGLPIATEIVSTELADMMSRYVDVFQVGTRNMQNFELLKRVGACGKPVILKRGLAATIEEWLMAAEYLMAHGTDDVILCERGIRTFETYTRNTLDLSAIPVVQKLSHLPVIVDPSHATGIREKVPPMALAAVAAGADGLLLEVHPDPEHAQSDGPQSLYPGQFERLMRDVEALAPVVGKEVERVPARRAVGAVEIRSISRAVDSTGTGDAADTERKRSVAFQGERGAFSETALYRFFDEDSAVAEPSKSFRDVFDRVLSGECDYGILPIENSLAGSIHENYDLLLQYPDIKIIGEQRIRIVHNLIGLPGTTLESVTKVYSHPQGLAQCAAFLDSHPEMQGIPYYDTAGSVAFVAEQGDTTLAAIAGTEAASAYKLEILKESIETNPRNYTRFFVVARSEARDVDEPNKASLVFSAADKPGSLFRCLQALADRGLNMKKLESRPIHGKPWQYMFYVDVEVPDRKATFTEGIAAMNAEAEDIRVLGVYRI